MRRLCATLAAILILSCLGSSAGKGNVEVGFAYTLDDRLGLLGGWDEGFAVVALASRTLREQVALEARASYRHAAFEEYRGLDAHCYTPETQLSPYRGGDSDIFTASAGLRVTGKGLGASYMSIRPGVLFMRVGEVSRTYWNIFSPDERYLERAPGTGELATEPFWAGAIGVPLPGKDKRVWLEGEMAVFPRLAGSFFSLGTYIRFGPD